MSENGKVARIGCSFELDAGDAFRRGLWDGCEAISSRKTYRKKEEVVFISLLLSQISHCRESGEKLPIKSRPTFCSHTSHQQHQLWWSKHSNYIDAN